jgi:hypothetical protein
VDRQRLAQAGLRAGLGRRSIGRLSDRACVFGARNWIFSTYQAKQAASGKRQAASGKRQAASGKRQAASGKRQAASGKRQAASGKREIHE